MKIYQLENNRHNKAQRQGFSAKLSGLKKAAGAEDMVSLTREAIDSFKRNNIIKIRDQELKKLALDHINDHNPDLEGLENDPEFMKAERLALMAELVIRVAPSGSSKKIYGRVADFVMEQLCCNN